jgi:hypothetical protein
MTTPSKFECINCGDSSVCDKKSCFHFTQMSNKEIALREAAIAAKAREEEREKVLEELFDILRTHCSDPEESIFESYEFMQIKGLAHIIYSLRDDKEGP